MQGVQSFQGQSASLPLIEAPSSDQQEVEADLSPELNERPSISVHPWIESDDESSTRLPIIEELVNRFSVSESLTLPVPSITLPPKELLQQQWISELQQILLKVPRGLQAPVSIVSVDYKFRKVLINWLIAAMTQAHPPLTSIIVFSIDESICKLLRQRRINCVFVAPKDFLTQTTRRKYGFHACRKCVG